MLHPRLLSGLGLAIVIAGLLATLRTDIGDEAIVTGVPVGLAVPVAARVGEGDRGNPPLGTSAVRAPERSRQGDHA